MPEWLTQLLNEFLYVARAVLQSDLTSTIAIAVITAFAGAFAGAYAAQRIAERAKSKEDLLKEIRNTNAGISVAFSIFNAFFALKEQHVEALKRNFDKEKIKVEDALRAQQESEIENQVISYLADFKTLQPIAVPIERLQSIVFENLSVAGRPLNVTTDLTGAIKSLTLAIVERNELIRERKENPPASGEKRTQLYFGFPDRDGNVDETYAHYIDAIYQQTDNCIYFSKILIEDLAAHGNALKRTYNKQFRGTVPSTTEVDLTSIEKHELMPSPKNFVSWTEAFSKKESRD